MKTPAGNEVRLRAEGATAALDIAGVRIHELTAQLASARTEIERLREALKGAASFYTRKQRTRAEKLLAAPSQS